jgi:serine/threonine-protein kinase
VVAGGRAAILSDARRALEFEHPNLVRVRAVEAAGMDVVVVTEFVDGEVYADMVDAARERGTPLPVNVCLRVLADVLNGFVVLHAGAGPRRTPYVHGRLAPVDVLVGADGVARIAIGARNVRSDHARVMGYLAPEIILASDLDADERTDVYAAGVLLWEALAGQRLYNARTAELLLSQQLRGQIPTPDLAPDVLWAQSLLPVAFRALSTDPKDRYPTAAAMLDALREAAGRRIARPDDVASWVEQVAGPFIRARRREASISLGASDSDIRAMARDTEPDTSADEPTLSLAGDAPEPNTDVIMPRLHEDDEDDEAKTKVDDFEEVDALDPTLSAEHEASAPGAYLEAPADGDKPTLTAEIQTTPGYTQETAPEEEPSVTSTLPPAVQAALLDKQRALLEEEREKQIAGEPDVYGDESITALPRPRGKQDSIVTLDMATERRTHPASGALRAGQARVSSGMKAARPHVGAPSDEQETLDRRDNATARAIQEARRAGRATEEDLAETAQMVRSAPATADPYHLSPRTSPIAMPVPGNVLPATGSAPAFQAAMPSPVGPPRPGPGMAPGNIPLIIASPLSFPRPPPVPSGPLQPSVPGGARVAATVSTTRDRGSSFLLGVITFFLVLASLAILAWLTMPYWRAYVDL